MAGPSYQLAVLQTDAIVAAVILEMSELVGDMASSKKTAEFEECHG
jgi:hypothetical protein